jgi:hypothetical protein
MNRVQRLTYLAQLGIDNYVSRVQLKGAAPSSLLDPLLLDHRHAVVELELPTEMAEQQVPPLRLLSTNAAPVEVDIEKTAAAVVESGPSVILKSESIRFSLNCCRISDDLLVLDTREFGAALPTDTLLLNIARSIGYPLAQLPHSELLRWPLFSDDRSASDESQARAMVQAYIQAQVSKKPAKYLFLMGLAAAQFTLDEYNHWHLIEGKIFQQWQMTLVIIPSLAAMLRDPSLKRVTWQVIKSLC